MVGNLLRRPRTPVAPTQTATRSPRPTAGSHGEAEGLLRELAFVLHLTRSVKQRILEERETEAASLALAATDDGI
jgi:hypothetical protein